MESILRFLGIFLVTGFIILLFLFFFNKEGKKSLAIKKIKNEEAIIPIQEKENESLDKKNEKQNFDRKFAYKQYEGLLKVEELQNLKEEEIHHVAHLQKAAESLGNIAERMEKELSFREEGLKFYQKCAKDLSLLSSIRKRCRKNLLKWSETLSFYPSFS